MSLVKGYNLSLLDIPDEIIQKIFHLLNTSRSRKSLKSTSRELYLILKDMSTNPHKSVQISTSSLSGMSKFPSPVIVDEKVFNRGIISQDIKIDFKIENEDDAFLIINSLEKFQKSEKKISLGKNVKERMRDKSLNIIYEHPHIKDGSCLYIVTLSQFNILKIIVTESEIFYFDDSEFKFDNILYFNSEDKFLLDSKNAYYFKPNLRNIFHRHMLEKLSFKHIKNVRSYHEINSNCDLLIYYKEENQLYIGTHHAKIFNLNLDRKITEYALTFEQNVEKISDFIDEMIEKNELK